MELLRCFSVSPEVGKSPPVTWYFRGLASTDCTDYGPRRCWSLSSVCRRDRVRRNRSPSDTSSSLAETVTITPVGVATPGAGWLVTFIPRVSNIPTPRRPSKGQLTRGLDSHPPGWVGTISSQDSIQRFYAFQKSKKY